MPRPERPRPNMDPRAKSVADGLYSDLESLLVAIPVGIACIVIAGMTDSRPQTIIWIAVAGSIAYASIRAFLRWLRRAPRTDPTTIDEP